jgi:hypothetical protein
MERWQMMREGFGGVLFLFCLVGFGILVFWLPRVVNRS